MQQFNYYANSDTNMENEVIKVLKPLEVQNEL